MSSRIDFNWTYGFNATHKVIESIPSRDPYQWHGLYLSNVIAGKCVPFLGVVCGRLSVPPYVFVGVSLVFT